MAARRNTPSGPLNIDHALVAGRTSEGAKLAQRGAMLIQQEIIFGNLDSGCLLGTVAQIRARHKLGRWAFREALAILEQRGVARLRPGPGGGVVVAEPDFGNIVELTLLYIYIARDGIRELVEAEAALLSAMVNTICDPASPLPRALRFVNDEVQVSVPRALAYQTGNPAFELIVEYLESVRKACAHPDEQREDPNTSAARALWHAIACGDAASARAALERYLEERNCLAMDRPCDIAAFSKHHTGGRKVAYRLALRILQTIGEQQDAPEVCLGSEADIAMRFDTNGEIVRQTVRLLEDLDVVASQRGRSGGIVLRKPDTVSISSLLPHILSRHHLAVSDCYAAAGLLSVEIARLAASRAKNPPVDGVQPAPLDGAADAWRMILIDRQIQAFAQNPLLASLERGLLLYSCVVAPPSPSEDVPLDRMMALSASILHWVERSNPLEAERAAKARFALMSLRFV
jgi:DNA-binding FadR family transcriptional regulator